MLGWFSEAQELGFPLKARQPLGVLGELLGQDFYSHVTAQVGVLGAVHLTHATLADLF